MAKLFVLITVIYWFSLYVYMPILTPYVEGLGASLSMVGLVVGSYGFTQMLIRIPLGIYSDRIGKRKIFVIAGVACAALSCIGLGFASAPWLALVFRGAAGVAAAAWVVFTVLYSSYFPPEETGRAMSAIMFATSLGQLLGTTLGGFVADALGYKAPFVIGGVVGLIGLMLSTKLTETGFRKEPIQLKTLLQVGKDPELWKVSLLAVLAQAINFVTIYGFNQSYAVSIGAGDRQLTYLMMFSALAIAVGSQRSGAAAAKIGERQLILLSFILMGFGSIAVPFTDKIWILYITQALNGIGRGLIFPVLMSQSIRAVAPEKRSTAMGFFQAIYGIGMTLGPVIAGWFSDLWGMSAGYLTAGAFGLLGCIAVIQWSLPGLSVKITSKGDE